MNVSRDLIIETDIGRDPDDLWALLYLLSTGCRPHAVVISPGDKDQVAIASFVRDELGCNYEIGARRLDSDKTSCRGRYHQSFLDRYGYPYEVKPDGYGPDVVERTFGTHPNTELLVIGPLSNVGEHIKRSERFWCRKATMQGGFIGYDVHGKASVRVEKFEGRTRVQTFNLNASKELAFDFLKANIEERRFVGKHICHGVVYDQVAHDQVNVINPKNRASELFREAMSLYLTMHPEGKKFHDPIAIACHIHPDIAVWVKGTLSKVKGEWGADLNDSGDYIAVDLDYDRFWECIAQGY
jgi:inosine-uridine nucleoside N-ribohydrolase